MPLEGLRYRCPKCGEKCCRVAGRLYYCFECKAHVIDYRTTRNRNAYMIRPFKEGSELYPDPKTWLEKTNKKHKQKQQRLF